MAPVKSRRSELGNWHLCHWQLAPVQLQFFSLEFLGLSPRTRSVVVFGLQFSSSQY